MRLIGKHQDIFVSETTTRLHARGRAGGRFDRSMVRNELPRGKEGDMTNNLLAWYPQPEPHGTSCYAADLADADAVVRLFKRASQFRAQVTAQGWRFLWTHFGLTGL